MATPGTTFQDETSPPPAREQNALWKYFVPGLGEYLMVKDLLAATKVGDPVGIGLGGLSFVPILGPFLGITRAAKRGYGYHGTRNSPEELIKKGFKTGSSAELSLPGTSVTLDPTVALRAGFGSGDPKRLVAAKFKTKPLPLKPSDYIAGQVPKEGLIYSKPNLVFNEAETFAKRTKLPGSEQRAAEIKLEISDLAAKRQGLFNDLTGSGIPEPQHRKALEQLAHINAAESRLQNEFETLKAGDLPSVVARALSPQDLRFVEQSQEEAADASSLIYEALKSGGTLQKAQTAVGIPGILQRGQNSGIAYRTARDNPQTYAGFALSDLGKAVSLLEGLPGASLQKTEQIFQAASPLLKYKATGKEDDFIAEALAGKMRDWSRAAQEVKDVGSNTLANKKALAASPVASAAYNRAYSQLMASRTDLLNAVKAAGALPQGRSLGQDKIILQALKHDPASIIPKAQNVIPASATDLSKFPNVVALAKDIKQKMDAGNAPEAVEDWQMFLSGINPDALTALYKAGMVHIDDYNAALMNIP